MTTLSPERVAEIRALAEYLRKSAVSMAKCANMASDAKALRNLAAGDIDANYGHITPQQTREWHAAEAFAALLASHEALRAEVERLRGTVAAHEISISEYEKTVDQLETARDTAAREMREAAARIAVLLDDGAEIADRIRALPLPSEKETG